MHNDKASSPCFLWSPAPSSGCLKRSLALRRAVVPALLGLTLLSPQIHAQTAVAPAIPAAAVAVNPKLNFYAVTPDVYRSRQLSAAEAPVLHQLGIKTVINLRYFDRDDDVERLKDDGIAVVNVPMLAWSVSPKQIAQALMAIEEAQSRGKVLVHCRHGADRTGIVIGMYRIINQGWSADEAKREMVQGPYGFHALWRNLERMYRPENIQAVREELDKQHQFRDAVLLKGTLKPLKAP